MATQINLAEQQGRQRLTDEALASVDTGQVIAHQAVLAWAESLVSDNPLPLPGSLNNVDE